MSLLALSFFVIGMTSCSNEHNYGISDNSETTRSVPESQEDNGIITLESDKNINNYISSSKNFWLKVDYDRYYEGNEDYKYYVEHEPKSEEKYMHEETTMLKLEDVETMCKKYTSFRDIYREIQAIQYYPDVIMKDSEMNMTHDTNKAGGYSIEYKIDKDIKLHISFGYIYALNTSVNPYRVLVFFNDKNTSNDRLIIEQKLEEFRKAVYDFSDTEINSNNQAFMAKTIDELLNGKKSD